MAYKQKYKTLSTPKQISKKEHRHYWPYLPLLVVSFGLASVLFIGSLRATQVLGSSNGIAEDNLLTTTNQTRQRNHEPSLGINAKLSTAAQSKADDMVARDYWSHTAPDGKQAWSFVDSTGYTYQVVGENLAYGFSSGDEVVRGWLNSPSHRENLLSNDYTEVGFGIAQSPDFNKSGPETVVVALYAKPGIATTGDHTAVLGQKSGQESFGITRLETLAGNYGSLAVFLAGLITGIAVLALLTKHIAAVKRIVVDGERFVIHHPIIDVTLVSILLVCAFLAQTAGFIH